MTVVHSIIEEEEEEEVGTGVNKRQSEKCCFILIPGSCVLTSNHLFPPPPVRPALLKEEAISEEMDSLQSEVHPVRELLLMESKYSRFKICLIFLFNQFSLSHTL